MNKEKAARRRAHNSRMSAQRMEALNRQWEALLNQQGGFSRDGAKPKHLVAQSKAAPTPFRRNMPEQPLPGRYVAQQSTHNKKQLSPEMQEREDKAKRHYDENIRTRIGQVFNKGSASQYLTDSDLADQKKGLTRRRS